MDREHQEQVGRSLKPVCRVNEGEEPEDVVEELLHVTSQPSSPPLKVQLEIDDCQVTMEVDTELPCL